MVQSEVTFHSPIPVPAGVTDLPITSSFELRGLRYPRIYIPHSDRPCSSQEQDSQDRDPSARLRRSSMRNFYYWIVMMGHDTTGPRSGCVVGDRAVKRDPWLAASSTGMALVVTYLGGQRVKVRLNP